MLGLLTSPRFCVLKRERVNETTANSTFQINIRSLFSSLSSNAAANNVFYNSTLTSDTVYGHFMCRGDVPFQLCGQCVINATQKLSSDLQCSLSKRVHGSLFQPLLFLHRRHKTCYWHVQHRQYLKPGKLHAFDVRNRERNYRGSGGRVLGGSLKGKGCSSTSLQL
ncbi:hypothetical protein JHK87_015272 [Glycine soja]|nr:hypothetical protein JHK87_015272 [Glycine soja]